MGLGRKLIQTALLCGTLAMPPLAHGAGLTAEDVLARISIDAIPRLQREYLRATLSRYGQSSVIDLGAYILAERFDHWYVEGVFDGTPLGPHAPIPDEELVLTGELFELWQFSPFISYYLEVTEIPDCANGSVLLPTCR
ncbi:hypothetical protein [Rhizobium sp. CIAT894]|uniref:hypothetical protein n=1 Tax=Rhizobium sp. CIAT894 TaxID=2020312 RepID=UPI0001909C21|nr:hypothetical protein [Rhizobium sp. CIAT894]